MKEFSSSVRAADDGGQLEDLPFALDGVDYVLRAPKRTQLAFLVATSAASRTDADRIAAMLDFIEAALEPPGNEKIRVRLLDRDDPLELEHMVEVFNWALEQWSGRPPTSAAASSRRQLNGGRRSRAIASGAASTR